MELFIRAHDLKVFGEEKIVESLNGLGLSGVQLVAYKCLEDVKYVPGSITESRAKAFSDVLRKNNKSVALIGAYFNPVHSVKEKVENGVKVFEDYLRCTKSLGCNVVGSESGSFNDDKWTYNPENRTDHALETVVDIFGGLCKTAKKYDAFVGMEGAYGHVLYDVDRLDYATRKIGADNIKIIFDLYNYLDISNVNDRYEILKHGLKTFGDKICVFHIKDCVIEDGKLRQCGVGKGIFDYDLIIEEIARYVKNAKLVFEGTTGDDIPFAVEYVSKKIKSL